MKRIFIGICIPVIVLGLIAMAYETIFNTPVISFATQEKIQGTDLYWWHYDTWGYLKSLRNSFRTISSITLELPTRQWSDSIINNFAVIIDWLIFIVNILLFPLRIGGYFLLISLQMIGINTAPGYYEENPLKWLIELCYKLKDLHASYI